jgi:hypothetical protein
MMRTCGAFGSLPRSAGAAARLGADQAALGPVLCIVERGLVAGQAQGGGRHADTDTGLVHHVEHAAQAFARLADEVAHGAGLSQHRKLALAEIEQGVGGAAPTELVVEARQRHVVALASQLALGVHQLLGHDKERNALDPRHQLAVRPRNLGQHQVDDVLGELMLAGRDPHLVAFEPVARAQRVRLKALAIGHRAGGNVREGRARLRLRQAHGAGEAAIEFVGGKHLFLQRRAMRHQQIGIADGEQAAADADGRSAKEHARRRFDQIGQLHAAHRVVLGSTQHARLGVGIPGLLRCRRQDHLLTVEARLFGVDQAVEGGVLLARNALAGLEHRVEGLARMVGKARPVGQRARLQASRGARSRRWSARTWP